MYIYIVYIDIYIYPGITVSMKSIFRDFTRYDCITVNMTFDLEKATRMMTSRTRTEFTIEIDVPRFPLRNVLPSPLVTDHVIIYDMAS